MLSLLLEESIDAAVARAIDDVAHEREVRGDVAEVGAAANQERLAERSFDPAICALGDAVFVGSAW
jgi:hypothetical protein